MKLIAEMLNALGLDGASPGLKAASCTPVACHDVPAVLARLARTVGPAYLPIVEWQGSHFCLHVRPLRPLAESPVVFCDHEEQGALFVARNLGGLARGIWLWNLAFHDGPDRFPAFVAGLESLAARLPGGRSLPPEFHHQPADTGTRWAPSPLPDALWMIADIGHPMAGAPQVNRAMTPDELDLTLGRFLRAREHESPEALAMRLQLDLDRGLPVDVPGCTRVLAAEAWRESVYGFRAMGLTRGEGLAAWDVTLSKTLHGQLDALTGTAFGPLAPCTRAYTGRAPEGATLLREVAKNLLKMEDKETALNQLRNAAQIAVLTGQRTPSALCAELADVCDEIEPGGLATELTLAYADAMTRSP